MSARGESRELDCVVVGGGIFGCWLALHLAREQALSVALFEREPALLRRASYHNQARVHNGYHYPRSILTGLRSRVNSERFLREYSECIDHSFTQYYAVARMRSNVTASQFEQFCARIGAPLAPAEPHVERWFNPERVERVWRTEEWAFDADALAQRMRADLAAAGVEVHLEHDAVRAAKAVGARRLELEVRAQASGAARAVACDHVFAATYSNLNALLARSGVTQLALLHDLTEIVLVEVPPELEHVGVTLMCGPFFSFMPFPARKLHSLSHVRYTPHRPWRDCDVDGVDASFLRTQGEPSFAVHMIKDAERYFPAAADFRPRDTLIEIKTVLPQSAHDDSRPILCCRHDELPGLVSILGGKVDNIYDLERELGLLLGRGVAA
jgi:glycine/D-amino acid oxidase-like deaminating enzyme